MILIHQAKQTDAKYALLTAKKALNVKTADLYVILVQVSFVKLRLLLEKKRYSQANVIDLINSGEKHESTFY